MGGISIKQQRAQALENLRSTAMIFGRGRVKGKTIDPKFVAKAFKSHERTMGVLNDTIHSLKTIRLQAKQGFFRNLINHIFRGKTLRNIDADIKSFGKLAVKMAEQRAYVMNQLDKVKHIEAKIQAVTAASSPETQKLNLQFSDASAKVAKAKKQLEKLNKTVESQKASALTPKALRERSESSRDAKVKELAELEKAAHEIKKKVDASGQKLLQMFEERNLYLKNIIEQLGV